MAYIIVVKVSELFCTGPDNSVASVSHMVSVATAQFYSGSPQTAKDNIQMNWAFISMFQ